MTTTPRTTGRRIEGWLTQPPAHHGQPSEGHASAVSVLRMVNTRHQHTASEPVPFRARPERPAPLRSIKPAAQSNKPTPATAGRARGCGGQGGACISHPDCADHLCEGHPDNTEHPGSNPTARATFWRAYLAVVVLASIGAAVYLSTH